MGQYQIYKNLAALNELSPAEAVEEFLDCCGSAAWARRMAKARPFRMLDHLFEAADRLWFSLSVADHLDAFRAHPEIGSSQAADPQTSRSANWSSGEQSSLSSADASVKAQLADVNRLYKEKFGFIFIICATGRSADEMLAVARARLGNSVETELQLAAEEQAKITRVRLTKLLER